MSTAAILTYHRIMAEEDRRLFHDISISEFEKHLRMIADRLVFQAGETLKLQDGRYVYLTFDDGTADHRLVAELLCCYGLAGIFFVITGRLGERGYLTKEDVLWMSKRGHKIGSHTVTHRHLPELRCDELKAELSASKAALEALTEGQSVSWMAPPGGIYSPSSVMAAQAAGYEVIRTMEWGYATHPPKGVVPCLPVIGFYTARNFDGLLRGKAPLWLYALKQNAKRVLGLPLYDKIRNLTTP